MSDGSSIGSSNSAEVGVKRKVEVRRGLNWLTWLTRSRRRQRLFQRGDLFASRREPTDFIERVRDFVRFPRADRLFCAADQPFQTAAAHSDLEALPLAGRGVRSRP